MSSKSVIKSSNLSSSSSSSLTSSLQKSNKKTLIPDYFIGSNGLPNILNKKRNFNSNKKLLTNTSRLINYEENKFYKNFNEKNFKCTYNEMIKNYEKRNIFRISSSDINNRYLNIISKPKPYDNKIFGYDKPGQIILPPLPI